MKAISLYDLDYEEQRKVVAGIAREFKKNGYKRVPSDEKEFITGITKYNMLTGIIGNAPGSDVEIECVPEDAYDLYEYIMR